MINLRSLIASRMTDEDVREMSRIYAPTPVANGPMDAFNALCVMDDGEIRCYGNRPIADDPVDREVYYIASTDGGLSWKAHRTFSTDGPSYKSPYSNRRIGLTAPPDEMGHMHFKTGTLRIQDTADGEVRFVETGILAYPKPMVALHHKKRLLFASTYGGRAHVLISDDDGDSWKDVVVPGSDKFQLVPPHKAVRWENSGVEPTITELSDGTLMLIMRTSTDYHYVTYSHDHGETWDKPVPSRFHSTLTNPELLRLHDGRIVFFYNNTRPLPEFEKESVFPPLNENEITGRNEDVFTNRDTNCVAITEDEGNTWKGYRELYMNPLRNASDFRSSGGNFGSFDKSVHQFQAIELPYNKILVHVGQNEGVSKLIIFDIDWLYETERSENFHLGLGTLSTHTFVQSVTGNYRHPLPGHCCWNRTHGALLIPDPCGDHSEVLLLRNVPDPLLWNGYQGMAWNFPSLKQGTVDVRLCIRGKGVRVSVMNHWINPCDDTVPLYAQFSFVLTPEKITANEWHDLQVTFDTDTKTATLLCDGTALETIPMQGDAIDGVCYLHLQTLTGDGDADGTLIKRFAAHP